MLEELIRMTEGWPGVTYDIKWEHHLCFNVGGKMFMITSPDEVPVNASFKVNAENFEDWTNHLGCIAAPYLAKNKWIKIDDISRLSHEEWMDVLKISYEEVAAKLTKKLRVELGIL